MANVLLTERCVRSCPYCFAKQHMSDTDEEVMSWTDMIYVADMLQSSGENHISLLGGEPTLHPQFVDYVLYLLERNFHVNVFTSGIMSDKTFNDATNVLSGVHPERLSFVCNVNNPAKSNFSELESVRRFLKTFGHLTTPGFNIYQPDFNIDFIFDYINQYGLRRFVRLGLAHPIPGQKNAHIQLPQMKQMAEKLISYLPLFERFRVKPGLDCGFLLCMFSDEQIGKLFKVCGGRLTFGCGPAIDIGTDMTVWSCFPLSKFHKKSLYDFDSMQDMRKFYEQHHQRVRSEVSGIFEACDDCIYREEGLCQAGCLAHSISKFQNEAKVRMPEVYGNE